jgi:hypothetical protein
MHLNRINLEVAVESLLDLPHFSWIERCAHTMVVPWDYNIPQLRYINSLEFKVITNQVRKVNKFLHLKGS